MFEGEFVVVLNGPINDEECLSFAKSVFEFPSSTLVICAAAISLKKVLEEINKKAAELGRSALVAPDFEAVKQLFRPDKVAYFNHKTRKRLDVGKIVEPLKTDKTVLLVFGSPVGKEVENIALEIEVNLPSAVSIVLYAVREGLNPVGPTQS